MVDKQQTEKLISMSERVPPQMQDPLKGTKKRRVLPAQLIAKFRSKEDFIDYFEESLQLYVPPERMVNKDFLKKVFQEEKALFHLDDVKRVNMPRYDELSVRKFYPMLM